MSFRTIIIKNRSKLEYSLNYLICRKENEVIRIPLDEIRTVVIDTVEVSMTAYLLVECMKKKIKLIFTDVEHNPIGEAMPYQNNFYSYRHIKEQLAFTEESKQFLWGKIIERKIENQAKNLKLKNLTEQFEKLENYQKEIQDGDSTNREGHAAKVYFNSLFGKDFSRDDNTIIYNKYLNYGYSILLSSINREIKALGYLTELGIHHIGESNPFNLSCDLMEPLRPLVDLLVINNKVDENNYRTEFIKMLSNDV